MSRRRKFTHDAGENAKAAESGGKVIDLMQALKDSLAKSREVPKSTKPNEDTKQ